MRRLYSLLLIFSIIISNLSLKAQNSSINFIPYLSVPVLDVTNDTLEHAWAGGLNAAQFSTIDLDFDGDEDLFVFDRNADKIMTFINDNNKYKYAPEYEYQFPRFSKWVLLRDYNCDGVKDIFAHVNLGIQVYKNISISDTLKFELKTSPFVVVNGGPTNLFVSSVDLPSITDIDGDKDLDVLTFDVNGSRLEYFKNLSQENYGDCDNLYYELRNNCWGHFSEIGNNTNKLGLFDTCSNILNGAEDDMLGRPRHSGSAVLAIDIDNKGSIDLLLGDVGLNNIVMARNDSTKMPNNNTSLVLQDTNFPSYDVPVDVESFPGMYYEDIDFDGVKDLLVSPNETFLTDNTESVWMYKNIGTNILPRFQYQTNDFIQDEMIEHGTGAIPAFLDYNNDGLMDFIISNLGYYDRTSKSYLTQIALYENIGTASSPKFKQVDLDYLNVSSLGLGRYTYPTFADMDNDNDIDMIIGAEDGTLHYFENTATSGNVQFTLQQSNITDNANNVINVGGFAAPTLFDLDQDGDNDLVIGRKDGRLSYYENSGSATSPVYSGTPSPFGGVSVHAPWDPFGTITGFSTPHFYYEGNDLRLLIGSQRGFVYKCGDILGNLNGNFTVLDSSFIPNLRLRSVPAIADINNDNIADLLLGNYSGGVTLFEGTVINVSVNEIEELDFNIYPNPTNNLLNIELNSNLSNQDYEVSIYDVLGKKLMGSNIKNTRTQIDISRLAKGSYLLEIRNEKSKGVKRIVKY